MANPAGKVISIDNWSSPSMGNYLKNLAMEMQSEIPNVFVYSGSSPQDTERSLNYYGVEKVSLAFIDGQHTDEAAFEDFRGILPFINSSSIVLWHNAQDTWGGINLAWEKLGKKHFSRKTMLFSWGPLAIFLNESVNRRVFQYLETRCLLWEEWPEHLANFQTIRLNRRLRENFLVRGLLWARRNIRRKG